MYYTVELYSMPYLVNRAYLVGLCR